MQKVLFTAILFVCCSVFAFSQADTRRQSLSVLPFVGGNSGDGEILATILSTSIAREYPFNETFDVANRTSSALAAISAEHDFHISTSTNSDTIASIGQLFRSDYVLSGSITRLGNRNLLIITVVHVESYEQITGLYQSYRTLEEFENLLLPSISKSITDAIMQRGTSRRDSLAIVPFSHHPDISVRDAETLTEILAIELIKTGKYAILPRTSTIRATQTEQQFEAEGIDVASIGRAVNADYILSGNIGRLGLVNIFTVQIHRVDTQAVHLGTHKRYNQVSDGIFLMEEIAILLTDPENADERIAALNLEEGRDERKNFLAEEERRRIDEERDQARRLAQEERQQARDARKQVREEQSQRRRSNLESSPFMGWLASRRDYSRRSEVEHLSLFIGWETLGDKYGTGVGSSIVPFLLPAGIYWSPTPFFFIGFENRRVRFSEEDEGGGNYKIGYIPNSRFITCAPTLGFVLSPFDNGRVFANFLLEMGNMADNGAFGRVVSPGLSVGFIFDPPGVVGEWVSFDVKYRCIFLNGGSTQAVDFGVIVTFEAISRLFRMIF